MKEGYYVARKYLKQQQEQRSEGGLSSRTIWGQHWIWWILFQRFVAQRREILMQQAGQSAGRGVAVAH